MDNFIDEEPSSKRSKTFFNFFSSADYDYDIDEENDYNEPSLPRPETSHVESHLNDHERSQSPLDVYVVETGQANLPDQNESSRNPETSPDVHVVEDAGQSNSENADADAIMDPNDTRQFDDNTILTSVDAQDYAEPDDDIRSSTMIIIAETRSVAVNTEVSDVDIKNSRYKSLYEALIDEYNTEIEKRDDEITSLNSQVEAMQLPIHVTLRDMKIEIEEIWDKVEECKNKIIQVQMIFQKSVQANSVLKITNKALAMELETVKSKILEFEERKLENRLIRQFVCCQCNTSNEVLPGRNTPSRTNFIDNSDDHLINLLEEDKVCSPSIQPPAVNLHSSSDEDEDEDEDEEDLFENENIDTEQSEKVIDLTETDEEDLPVSSKTSVCDFSQFGNDFSDYDDDLPSPAPAIDTTITSHFEGEGDVEVQNLFYIDNQNNRSRLPKPPEEEEPFDTFQVNVPEKNAKLPAPGLWLTLNENTIIVEWRLNVEDTHAQPRCFELFYLELEIPVQGRLSWKLEPTKISFLSEQMKHKLKDFTSGKYYFVIRGVDIYGRTGEYSDLQYICIP